MVSCRLSVSDPYRSKVTELHDENQVSVGLTNGFWLGKYEVSQTEWKQVMATEPWKDKSMIKEGDVYTENPPGGRDPEVTGDGPLRSVRGGGFNSAASTNLSAFRGKQTPDN